MSATLPAATFRILRHRVGEGGRRKGADVLRIQQLLQLNGFKIQADGIWHSGVTDALVRFQRKIRSPTELYFDDNAGTARKSIAPNFGVNSGPEPRWIDPNDGLLFELAYGAGVLIRLAAGGSIWRHGIAFEYVHRWCEEQHIPFSMDWARPHAVWGFAGYPTWAVATQHNPEFGEPAFDTDQRRVLNCTLYANLMMSVWKYGNAHQRPFSAGVKDAGDLHHLARERYGYPLLGKYENAQMIREMTSKHPAGALFCVEFGESVSHMGLLYKGRVYECNVRPTRDVHSLTVEDWVAAKHGWGWVLGPAPA